MAILSDSRMRPHNFGRTELEGEDISSNIKEQSKIQNLGNDCQSMH